MRYLTLALSFFLTAAVFTSPAWAQPEEDAVAAVLDDFHDAASKADAERYFNHFTADAIFLGTDITERWTVDEFKAYALPAFNQGKGWTYVAQSRYIYLSPDHTTAWFDEILLNDKFGETRGTGVFVNEGGQWKLAQYHLTLPVPNALIYKLVDMIEGM